MCVETIEAVTPKDAGRKTFVDIARTYGLSADETDIHERRTLCFVADDGASAPTAPKILRCKSSSPRTDGRLSTPSRHTQRRRTTKYQS